MQVNSAQNERENRGMRIINFRTLLFCALFLCLGVLFAFGYVVYSLPFWVAFLIIPLLGLLCFLSFTLSQWKRICVSVGLLLVSFALGAGCFVWQIRAFQSGQAYEGTREVYGKVIAKETDGTTYAVVLDKLSVEEEETEGKLTAYVPASAYDTLSLADRVALKGNIRTRTELIGDYGFRGYTVEEDVRYLMRANECVVFDKDFDLFLSIRNRFEKVVLAGMDDTPAAVTIATLIGNTDWIEEGLLENVRRGGIAHIFAVSGLHVGALYGFCLWIIGKTKLRLAPKPVRFFLVLALLLFYGGICGYSASVIRATVMCLLFYLAKLAGFGGDFLETISAAVIIVLLISPVSLFTVGFQLSFAACFGMALFSRPISKLLYKLGDFFKYTVFRKPRKPFVLEEDTHPLNNWQRIARMVVSFLSATLGAQIATTPIQIAAFGYFSVWSLLLNCLFVPIVSVAFTTLLSFALVACCLPVSCSYVVLYIPNVVWSALLLTFETATFSSWAVLHVPAWSVCSYYLSAVLCSGRWNAPKWLLRVFAFLFAVVSVCILVLANV